ncbi:MAG TPA: mycothiol conjugate amidase Mca [Acidimicrobiia bacterium]|jgi:mycothiol S-conjugate amidase
MEEALCVLSIHAHPDDEASKGAATMARYAAEGVRTVLVTCTGGEAGDILNPEADSPEARADLAAVRMRELEASVGIIGYHELYLLGYRDSGMPDTEHNAHPDNFANADLDEAVGRLVRIIRDERPQVIISYPDAREGGYQHPDHIRVHDIGVLGFDRAGDADWYPDLGEPWQPLKLYSSGGFSRDRIMKMHEYFITRGEESPFKEWVERMPADRPDTTTTRIDIGDYLHVGRAALLAHRTQVAESMFFFRVPPEVSRELHPYEDFVLERSLVDTGTAEGDYETDLFQGIRVTTGS